MKQQETKAERAVRVARERFYDLAWRFVDTWVGCEIEHGITVEAMREAASNLCKARSDVYDANFALMKERESALTRERRAARRAGR